jgi:hypothetical protein
MPQGGGKPFQYKDERIVKKEKIQIQQGCEK